MSLSNQMLNVLPVLEGAIFASSAPMSAEALKKLVCQEGDVQLNLGEIRALLSELEAHYASRGIRLVQVASGYRFQIAPEVTAQLTPLFEEKPARFSRAFMETLALIAYRQPITRGEIEEIRGVVVSTNIMKTLNELDWVRIVGYKEIPGKPALYATTKQFLDFFNLKKLEDLPPLADLTDLNELTHEIEAKLESESDLGAQVALESEVECELECEIEGR